MQFFSTATQNCLNFADAEASPVSTGHTGGERDRIIILDAGAASVLLTSCLATRGATWPTPAGSGPIAHRPVGGDRVGDRLRGPCQHLPDRGHSVPTASCGSAKADVGAAGATGSHLAQANQAHPASDYPREAKSVDDALTVLRSAPDTTLSTAFDWLMKAEVDASRSKEVVEALQS